MRALFERLFEAKGQRQQDVALAGGLARQNQISRIVTNMKRGPSVPMLCKGILGLGMRPSEFFKLFEDEMNTAAGIDVTVKTSTGTQAFQVKPGPDPALFAEAQAAFWRVLAHRPGKPRRRNRRR